MCKSFDGDDLLSKLANKAKRKLNKVESKDGSGLKNNFGECVITRIDTQAEKKKLQKKIVQIISNNPDCIDPIGRLIDHKVYDNLTDSQKQNYIFKLSSFYREVCENLNFWFAKFMAKIKE